MRAPLSDRSGVSSSPIPSRELVRRSDRDAGWLAAREQLARFDARTGPAPHERALWAAAEALFATADGAPPAPRIAWLCDDARDFFAHAGPRARFLFGAALFFCTWIAPIVAGRFAPLHRLSLADRAHVLDRLEHGPPWQTGPLLSVKAILSILYFEHPDVAREIGFDAACKTEPS